MWTLVGPEAFEEKEKGLVILRAGLPIRVGAVAVDLIWIAPGEDHLLDALVRPEMSEGIPVAPIPVLVYMKMRSARRKDAADLVELIKAGIDIRRVRQYLAAKAPDLMARFDDLVEEAEREA